MATILIVDDDDAMREGLAETVTDLGYQCGYIDNFGYNTLDNGQNNQHSYLYGTYNFTDSLQAWSSLALYETLTAHQSNPPAAVLFAGGDYTWFDPGFVDKDHPNGRTITSAVRQFTPAEVGGGLDQFENHTRNRYVDFSVGLKGKIFNDRFDWEVAARRSQDKAHESFLESLNSVVDAYFLGPQLGTTADGLFDDQTEDLRLDLPQQLARGTHTLAVRVADSAGNVGSTSATFVVR